MAFVQDLLVLFALLNHVESIILDLDIRDFSLEP